MQSPKRNKKSGLYIRQLDYSTIAKMYKEGKSYSEISHTVNCSDTAVAYALKKMGITKNDRQ